MGRQKAVIKARREAKRVLRRDSRSHKQREEESVTSLVQMSGVEAIGMARDSRDTSPILARNEAQLHYLKAIESKQLIFATGEAGCGKTWISAAKAAEALNRPGFPGECFICELRLPDHRFRWKHNKLFLLLPEEYGPAFPAIVDCYTSPPT